MIERSKYLFVASMDVDPAHEHVFNQVYESEHGPNLLCVPGMRRMTRYTSAEFRLAIGGRVQQIEPSQPKYHAFYEIESPEVLVSDSWAEAIEKGRWPSDVRPFTEHRQHRLLKLIGDSASDV